MTDVSGLQLREPDQMDWADFNTPKSGYQRPPVPFGPDNKPIQFMGQIIEAVPGSTSDGYRNYKLTIRLTKNGPGIDGYEFREFVSVKKWQKKDGTQLNVSDAGLLLRAAGIRTTPQKNAEYDQAIKACVGKVVPFNLDWRGKCQGTGEKIYGFEAFPMDNARGERKAILKAGDEYFSIDRKTRQVTGTHTLTGEILFANATVSRFLDPNRK